MNWKDERIEELRRLWIEGLSATSIAAHFSDVSRSAVLGKVHRLGLARRRTRTRSTAPQVRRRRTVRTRPVETHNWRWGVAPNPILNPVKSRAAPSSAELRALEVQAGAKLLPLLELEPGMCRWPIGDPQCESFGFCGRARVEGIPYCLRHAIVAFGRRRECTR